MLCPLFFSALVLQSVVDHIGVVQVVCVQWEFRKGQMLYCHFYAEMPVCRVRGDLEARNTYDVV